LRKVIGEKLIGDCQPRPSIAECGSPIMDRAEPMHGEQRANYSQDRGEGDVG